MTAVGLVFLGVAAVMAGVAWWLMDGEVERLGRRVAELESQPREGRGV